MMRTLIYVKYLYIADACARFMLPIIEVRTTIAKAFKFVQNMAHVGEVPSLSGS